MLYLERRPAMPLSTCIRVLWYTCASAEPRRRERILPNGCVQLILNLSRDFLLDCNEDGSTREMAPSLVVGARSVFEIVDTSDMADLIGIVFRPGGITPFLSDSADVFSNRSTSLYDVWGRSAQELRERLQEALTAERKLALLEEFLLKRFVHRLARNSVVDFALKRFAQAPMAASVDEVARQTGRSMRYFSQLFREQVGMSPKLWCRIQRFQKAVRRLHAGGDVAWAELALECGYYDQSHFSNDFRAFSGINPTTYTARRTQWANHILAE